MKRPTPFFIVETLASWVEARDGDICDRVLLVVHPLIGDDRSIGNQRKMNPRIWSEIRLDIIQVNIESTIET